MAVADKDATASDAQSERDTSTGEVDEVTQESDGPAEGEGVADATNKETRADPTLDAENSENPAPVWKRMFKPSSSDQPDGKPENAEESDVSIDSQSVEGEIQNEEESEVTGTLAPPDSDSWLLFLFPLCTMPDSFLVI